MWDSRSTKILVANANWVTARLPGSKGFRLGRPLDKPWFVMVASTNEHLDDFRTHAEAITYAQKQARLALAKHLTTPPETLETP